MVLSAPRGIMGGCIGARLAGSIAIGLTLMACVFTFLYEEKRITMEWFNETQGPYNPAAIRHPKTGEWLLFFRIEEIWYGISDYTKDGTYLEGRMRSHPLLARMGRGAVPASQAQGDVSMLDLAEGYMRKARSEGSDIYKASDWRPFVWDGQIYLGHWVAYLPAQERMAISVLHLEQGKTELVHRFSSLSKEIEDSVQPEVMAPQASYSLRRSLLPGRLAATVKTAEKSAFRREKNWGFLEEDGKLLITYALLPCTVVLEFNPAQPEDLQIRSRHCYVADAPAMLQYSGLDILNTAMHISGNPVPFDIQNGAAHQEYLVLLHTKAPEYVNWAVRLDRATKRITHVSAGPILRNQDYRNEGFLQTALVVSSFHVLPKEGHAQTPADTFIRIFYGEGDRYGCWLDIDTRSIVWHALESSLGSSVAPAESGSHQHSQIAPI